MRPNSKLRLGLTLVVVAIVLIAVYSLTRKSATPPAADNAAPANMVSTNPGQPTSARGMMVVALEDIPPGTLITRGMVKLEKPQNGGAVPGDVFTELGQVWNCVSAPVLIPTGAAIHKTDVLGHITRVGVAGMVQPGMRAMSVPINGPGRNTMHDLVHIGDHVDIVASFDQQESRTLLTDVRVLLVDVFGKDYPPSKVAMRGAYKAEPQGDNTAPQPGQPAAPGNATQPAPGAPGAPAPAATPTPTPGGAPPPAPEPSLTLEVNLKQATALQLAMSSGAVIDYVLRPHLPALPATAITTNQPVVAERAVTIKREIAPYAEQKKNAKPAKSSGSSGPAPRIVFPPPSGGGGSVPPLQISPPTYNIPIYGDGQLIRTETVRKPGR